MQTGKVRATTRRVQRSRGRGQISEDKQGKRGERARVATRARLRARVATRAAATR